MSRQGLGVVVALVVVGSSTAAGAEDVAPREQPVARAAEVAKKDPPAVRAAEVPAPTPREPPQVRWLFSVSGGADLLAPNGPDDARYGMAWGLHVGSRFPTGVSVTLGYDNLELRPNGNEGTPWQLIDMSARYTLKYGPVKPFGEVVGGLSFISTSEPLDPGNGPVEVDLAAGLAGGRHAARGQHLQRGSRGARLHRACPGPRAPGRARSAHGRAGSGSSAPGLIHLIQQSWVDSVDKVRQAHFPLAPFGGLAPRTATECS